MRVLGALLVGALVASEPGQSKYAIAGIADDRIVEAFIAELRGAARRNDRQLIAGLIQYPITVTAGGMRIPITDASIFLSQYDIIFTDPMKQAIATGPVVANADGVGIGYNIVWFRPVAGGVLKITAMTVPLNPVLREPSSPRAGASAAPRTATPRSASPTRIIFRSGQSSTRAWGTLGAREVDSYIVYAMAGQLLDVRIEGVRGPTAGLRILDATRQTPVDDRAGRGLKAWTGRVPSAGDYRIEISRTQAAHAAGALDYTLVVTRR